MRGLAVHCDFDGFPNSPPSAAGQVSGAIPIPQVLNAGSGLDPQREIQSQVLFNPSRQVDRMKLTVGNDGRAAARPLRQTFREPFQQSLLQFQIRVSVP